MRKSNKFKLKLSIVFKTVLSFEFVSSALIFISTLVLLVLEVIKGIRDSVDTVDILIVFVIFLTSLINIFKTLRGFINEYYYSYLLKSPAYRQSVVNEVANDQNLGSRYQNSGYTWEIYGNGEESEPILYSHKIEEWLKNESENIPISKVRDSATFCSEQRMILNNIIKTKLDDNRVIFNSGLVKLRSDLFWDTKKVEFSLTDYFTNICSNDMIYSTIRLKKKPTFEFSGKSFSVDNTNNLIDLKNSNCANIVGVNSLIFTADGYIVVNRQNAFNDVNSHKLVPSGSGSATARDFKSYLRQAKSPTLAGFLNLAAEREMSEESHIPADWPRYTRQIGYFRLLNRGGKPDFFAITYIPKNFDEINSNFKSETYRLAKKNNVKSDLMEVEAQTKFSCEDVLKGELDRDNFSVQLYYMFKTVNYFYTVKAVNLFEEIRAAAQKNFIQNKG